MVHPSHPDGRSRSRRPRVWFSLLVLTSLLLALVPLNAPPARGGGVRR